VAGLGGLDAVVTCAGIDVPGPFESTDPAIWERIVAVNLLGTAAVVRAALPPLRASRGRVITVASTLGHRVAADATAYCASKFGVVGFTRALTAELQGEVAITLLTPGGMATAFFDGRDERYKPPADMTLCDPAEVAAAVVYVLARPAGSEIKELIVTGPAETSWP
jgi:NAD(P)-dependent dehydrogenase (short-subunit alcohol dehydrogenase family)